MEYNKDPSKVAAKYTTKAKALMREAALAAIKSAPGYTVDKPAGNATGYKFNANLNEVILGTRNGQPSVTCKVEGSLATYPQDLYVGGAKSSPTLLGGTTDRDVEACIKAAVTSMVTEQLIPTLNKLPQPQQPPAGKPQQPSPSKPQQPGGVRK
jgi:hypothetical protein